MAEDVAGSSMPQDILNTFYSGENPLCVMQNLAEEQSRRNYHRLGSAADVL